MITYPIAVDENGDVHNIGTITQENRADHKYFCLGCDGEMVPVLCNEDRESHFRHKVVSIGKNAPGPSSTLLT